MTKNILAIAIAAAVMAPSAFAAATVYGNAHMSMDAASQVKDTATTEMSQNNVVSNSSFIGIKGSEDLAGGMKAVFQFEQQIGLDGDNNVAVGTTTTGFQAQRNSFVGLGGGFGTVLLGIHDTPLKMVGRKYDMFGDRIGDTRNITSANASAVNFDARPGNVIAYASPTFGGVSGLIAFVNDESGAAAAAGTSGDTSAVSAMIGYAAGKLTVDAAYETHGAGFSSTAGTASYKALAATRFGAGYDFGTVKVQGFYGNQDVATATDKVARDVYGVGAGVKVGSAGTIKAQYAVAAKYNSLDNGADLMAIGYDHALSKNTTAYVAYAAANNASAATYTMNGAGHGVGSTVNAGKDPSAFSVGVQHKF